MNEHMTHKHQTGDRITLNTAHPITHEPRTYIFQEINQEYGSRIFWKYVLLILKQWKKVKELISGARKTIAELKGEEKSTDEILKTLDGFDSTVGLIAGILPELFSWESIEELSGVLLSDHIVKIGDTEYQADERGYSSVPGDPMELFFALFFAMCVNWPKYLGPLLAADLEDLTRDSGPEQKQSEAEKD